MQSIYSDQQPEYQTGKFFNEESRLAVKEQTQTLVSKSDLGIVQQSSNLHFRENNNFTAANQSNNRRQRKQLLFNNTIINNAGASSEISSPTTVNHKMVLM